MELFSVNFHFWPYCNLKCKYCFARFKNIKDPLTKEDNFKIINKLAKSGVKKINFVGGEPTLCPFLGELIQYAKNNNLTTSIVSKEQE